MAADLSHLLSVDEMYYPHFYHLAHLLIKSKSLYSLNYSLKLDCQILVEASNTIHKQFRRTLGAFSIILEKQKVCSWVGGKAILRTADPSQKE